MRFTPLHPMMSSPARRSFRFLLSACVWLAALLGGPVRALDFAELVKSVEPERAARYEVFRNFQIKGICGTSRLDLASQWGANTIRTYVPPTRAQLDEYQKLGFKVIVGLWMPHHGENKGNSGKWNYDYTKQGDAQLKALAEVIARIGDHPAILLWCFGNEVHLEAPYLETVERMSRLLHEKNPRALSSLTMINAPKDKVALIKQLAPDLDVIGYNSYGQGAVTGASRNLEEVWGRAYYVSEFGAAGPWGGRKTPWGVFYEQSYDAKLEDLRKSFARIDSAPRCLGSTMFLWGYWTQQLPTYFSAFLTAELGGRKVPDNELYLTPIAEEFARYWSGHYPPGRAPVLTKIAIPAAGDAPHVTLPAGKKFTVTATAVEPSGVTRPLHYRWWILDHSGKPIAGPFHTEQASYELTAPAAPGKDFFVLGYVIAAGRWASGYSVPFQVE